MAINKDDPAKFDMYRCEVASGALTLDTENPGDVLGWGTEDESFEVREAVAMNPADSSTIVRVRDSAAAEWRDLVVFPYAQHVQSALLGSAPARLLCLLWARLAAVGSSALPE